MNSKPKRFTFSVRDLAYLVTFLCVVLGVSLRAGEQSPLVLLNGIVLAVIVFVSGAWLYKWIIVGACATHAIWLFMYAASYNRPTIIESSELLNLSVIALTLGATVGVTMGLGPRRETSSFVVLGLFATIVFDIFWFLSPDVQ